MTKTDGDYVLEVLSDLKNSDPKMSDITQTGSDNRTVRENKIHDRVFKQQQAYQNTV